MTTSPVFSTKSGTGFTIDVTACGLSTDLAVKDFIVLFGTSPSQVINPNANWTKTTSTVLTYNGTSLASTNIEIRRSTPTAPINTFAFSQKIASGDINAELDRISRRAEEYQIFGIGPGTQTTVTNPLDTPFGVAWDGNTVNPPTMNSVYDYVVGLAPKASPTFTGSPVAPTPSTSDNSTLVATTAYVKANLASYAPLASPTFTGSPVAPTQASSDSSTKIATTGFVYSLLASANALGVTQAVSDNTTKLATTAFAHLASVVKKFYFAKDTTVRGGTGVWSLAVGSASITPRSNTSRFLVLASGGYVNTSGTGGAINRLRLNNASTIATGSAYQGFSTAVAANYANSWFVGEYFPGNTTPFTLQLELTSHDGSAFAVNGANAVILGETVNNHSTMVVIEYENTL